MTNDNEARINADKLLDVQPAMSTLTFDIPSMVGNDGLPFKRDVKVSAGRAFRIYRGIVAPRPRKPREPK